MVHDDPNRPVWEQTNYTAKRRLTPKEQAQLERIYGPQKERNIKTGGS